MTEMIEQVTIPSTGSKAQSTSKQTHNTQELTNTTTTMEE